MLSSSTKEAANITKEMAANDLRNSARDAGRDVRHGVEGVVDDLSNYAGQAGRKVRHFLDSATDTVTDSTKQVTDRIEKNPLTSSAIALGIGVVIGALLRR